MSGRSSSTSLCLRASVLCPPPVFRVLDLWVNSLLGKPIGSSCPKKKERKREHLANDGTQKRARSQCALTLIGRRADRCRDGCRVGEREG
jgi:hypothetical protein